MRFGLLTHRSFNLGDEIQSVAAEQYLPRVDVLLQRDNLDRDPGGNDAVCTILNGWFAKPPIGWPPHPRISPLPVSMHISRRRPLPHYYFWRQPPAAKILSGAGIEWFNAHAPIGARDRATSELLASRGIEAEYTGCLTLTLRRPEGPREDYVVACDMPGPYLAEIKRRTSREVRAVSHWDEVTRGHDSRMAKARKLLSVYARAHAVITSRLHAALPCLALGTPVLFVPIYPDADRQQPGVELARCVQPAKFLHGHCGFDPNSPPANPTGWMSLADRLRQRCTVAIAAAR